MPTISILQIAQVCRERKLERLAKIVDPLNAALALADAESPLRASMFLAQVAHESGEFRYSEEIASGAAYEGRHDLGNTEPGDGKRFKGRGWIQITGRSNYRHLATALGLPLLDQPELAALPEHAGKVAAWFWRAHGLNAHADNCDLDGCTRIINGGRNGEDARALYYARACEVLLGMPAPIVVTAKKGPAPK